MNSFPAQFTATPITVAFEDGTTLTVVMSLNPTPFSITVIGSTGRDGASAYEVWLAEGNVGTEQVFLDSLKGTKGDKGDKGDDGDPAPPVNIVDNLTSTSAVDALAARQGKALDDKVVAVEGSTDFAAYFNSILT